MKHAFKTQKRSRKKWSIFETKKKKFFNKLIIYIIFECWVVIRNRNREPPALSGQFLGFKIVILKKSNNWL
jgi:hypothetical protein